LSMYFCRDRGSSTISSACGGTRNASKSKLRREPAKRPALRWSADHRQL
jgi:hypothetical protein